MTKPLIKQLYGEIFKTRKKREYLVSISVNAFTLTPIRFIE